jgi:hypothetical protein
MVIKVLSNLNVQNVIRDKEDYKTPPDSPVLAGISTFHGGWVIYLGRHSMALTTLFKSRPALMA